jgi:hypothetical protein
VTALEPGLAPIEVDDDDPVHLTCCSDAEMSLCGLDVAGEYVPKDVLGPGETCIPCQAVEVTRACPHGGECPNWAELHEG